MGGRYTAGGARAYACGVTGNHFAAERMDMPKQDRPKAASVLMKDDQIVIGGAGGFIAGSLTRYFHDQGFTRIRAIDKKPLPQWYQRTPGVECLCMDLSHENNCKRAYEGTVVKSRTLP
jgi:hypothetical protein